MSAPSVQAFEAFLEDLPDSGWQNKPIARTAEAASKRALLAEYRQPQSGFYVPQSEASVQAEVFNANRYHLIRLTPSCLVRPGDVFLDVVAHIGLATAAVLRTPATRCVAIEPCQATRAMLERNLAAIAPASRFRVEADGISEEGGPRTLYHHPARRFLASVYKTRVRSRSAPTEQIDTVTLSDLILRDPPDISKLDVKGAETCVLGVSPAILRRIRVLLIEWNSRTTGDAVC